MNLELLNVTSEHVLLRELLRAGLAVLSPVELERGPGGEALNLPAPAYHVFSQTARKLYNQASSRTQESRP